MPLLRRRRPLLRAAAVGGGAYLAGKHHVQKQDEAYYEGQQSVTGAESAPAAAPAAAPASGVSSDALDRLRQLGQLHDQGVLTDDEFAKEKQRIIGQV